MGQRPFKQQQPQHRQTSKTFWITLIAVVALTILLGILITWLLLTQDLSKATSLVSLIASILAIVVAPITILSFVSRSTASPGDRNPHTNAPTHLAATQMPPLTAIQLSIRESQPSSNAPLPTSDISQSTTGTSQVKEDVNMARWKKFDVFLSYSSKDKIWVNRLKEALQNQGLKVWLDHDQIRPGELFAGVLERGLEESKAVALIVSPESMESGWVEEEYARVLSLVQHKQQPLQLIPVILRKAEIPGFLASRQWVDFREESLFTQSLEQLIWGITGKRPTTSAAHKEDNHFQAGPPLSGDTSLYIERKADREALTHLRNMDYISFIEPRLQGKTSLIYRLLKQLAPKGYAFVICDLTNERFRKESEEEWYRSLGKWVLNNLDFIPEETPPSLPSKSTEWQTFLETIAKAAKETKRSVVIILDELRDMPFAYATPFFTVIRSIYNERAIIPSLEHLTFITSGAFNPKELIQDEGVSKFNVDQRIELEDFTLAQVRELVDNLQLPDDVAETVAKRVYFWTEGQPYLTQKLCLLLTGISESELMQSPQLTRAVDRLARQLFGDPQYLMRIRRLSEREPKLFQYIQGIANGHRPRFNQALNDEHFRLANIYGVMKADSQSRCRIRNRVCGQALKEFSMYIHS
jgi:hypothetical protein